MRKEAPRVLGSVGSREVGRCIRISARATRLVSARGLQMPSAEMREPRETRMGPLLDETTKRCLRENGTIQELDWLERNWSWMTKLRNKNAQQTEEDEEGSFRRLL